MENDLPLGPVDEPLVIDDFSYEEVKTKKCAASVCENICEYLMAAASDDSEKKYLAICVPCYNENLEELMKTFLSLMENVDFMQRKVRKASVAFITTPIHPFHLHIPRISYLFTSISQARLHGDDSGIQLKKDFINTIPIIVPIFDGTKALSPSLREWLTCNFKGCLEGMDGPSEPGKVDVRVGEFVLFFYVWFFWCIGVTFLFSPSVRQVVVLLRRHADGRGGKRGEGQEPRQKERRVCR